MELKSALNRAQKRWLKEKIAHKEGHVGAWAKCKEPLCGQLYNVWNPYLDERDSVCVDCRLLDILELRYNDEY